MASGKGAALGCFQAPADNVEAALSELLREGREIGASHRLVAVLLRKEARPLLRRNVARAVALVEGATDVQPRLLTSGGGAGPGEGGA